jgi:PAS domain S-box-containing protein
MQTSSLSRSTAGHASNNRQRYPAMSAILYGVIENADGYMWLLDQDLHYIILNTQLRNKIKEVTGRDTLPGSNVVDCIGMLDASQKVDWEKIYDAGFQGISHKLTQQLSIGYKTVFYDIAVNPVREAQKIIALSCSVKDVTEEVLNTQKRKKAEEALQQSELKFRSLIENSTDIITMADAEGNIFYGSPSSQKILGYEEADYMGRHVCSFIHPDSLPVVAELLQNLIVNPNKLFTIDLKIFDKSGKERWVQGLASNMLEVPGVNALVGNYRDITERKIAEEQIRESEYLYKNLFNNSPLPVYVCEAEKLQFVEVNEATVQLYGYSRKEFLKMTAFDIISSDQKQGIQQLLPKTNHENRPSVLRKHTKKNGETIFVEVLAHAINYKGKNAWLVLINDITEKIQLQNQLVEEKIRRQQEIAQAVIDAQEKERETLGRELHDNISQVLTTARLYLICAKDSPAPAQQMNMIQRSSDTINSAIEEIRRLSKSMIETFHKEVGLELSLNDLIENIQLVQKFQIRLNFSVPNEQKLDDKLKKTVFRIIQEQLNNIVKHAEASVITIDIIQKKHSLQVSVADNGKGFDITLKRKGIGISNIISRTELFNGRVKIDSSPGNGCRMQVSFNI